MRPRFSLSLALLLLSLTLSAQTYRYTFSHDTVGNRISRVYHGVVPAKGVSVVAECNEDFDEDSIISEEPDEAKVLSIATPPAGNDTVRRDPLARTPAEKEAYLQAMMDYVVRMGPISDGQRAVPHGPVGEIPLSYGVSGSGARTYSIPIYTAPDIRYAPSLSLVYNSRGGYGYGGYGWDISGLSAITLTSKSLYWDNLIMAPSTADTDGVFCLDGVRLVTNTDPATCLEYPLVTAAGHILAAPVAGSGGYIKAFDVLYPDGSRARYGFGANLGTAARAISYKAYDRPASISQGGYSATFIYNDAHERVKKQIITPAGEEINRHYIGGRYEVEFDTDTFITTEMLWLGGDAYSAPMVLRKQGGGSWTPYVIGRDYLGSITHIATTGGTQVEERSYDAWGRLRDPATNAAYDAASQPSLFLGRGWGGHEYLADFGLYNLNARLYDPVIGRFLSPDPYVQAPDNPANFNRYAYGLNNPLKYTDESGEFFIIDSFIIGLIGGGWDRACQMAKNDAKLWGGLFVSDNNLNTRDRVSQVLSRFTFEITQTLIGFLCAQTINTLHLFDGVKSVEYLHGATVTSVNDYPWLAFTMGSYITGNKDLQAANDNELFQHEFGHYLQSQELGPHYLGKIGIPSLLSKNTTTSPHSHNPVEQDANIKAFCYFTKYYASDFDIFDSSTGEYTGLWKWKETQNPIIGINWRSYGTSTINNKNYLSNNQLTSNWCDALFYVHPIYGFLLQGIANSIDNYFKY